MGCCCIRLYLQEQYHILKDMKKISCTNFMHNSSFHHVEIYAGKDFPIQSDEGQAQGVVMELMGMSNLLNKGYHLITDNFYTKPVLAQTLLDAQTLLTRTVRANTKGLPSIPTKINIGE